MRTSIKISLLCAIITAIFGYKNAHAQVTPVTTDVKLFCDATDLDLGAAPNGEEWHVWYSTSPTTTPTDGVVLTGTTIPAASLQTGYYYIATQGTAEGSCMSEMVEVPVYKFAPLTVDFTAPSSYCIEDVTAQELIGTVTTTDAYQNFAYQWYTVEGTTETPIDGATTATYKPTSTTPGDITYRLKGGYLVDALRYCSATVDKTVTVTAKPATPTITIEGNSDGETW